ncbi:hypothetical protein GCM10017771_35590 [Streptomyces capitiformicae]|uniref:Uncharacterized protein n=1 Tax=Streptomyces capitiformicae TaxID=2014920 RepID=A0A919L8M7_9ACTN|nr:hypothetical protein GCM10017771_35590 [Streptomyces capitiformicae]
MAAPSALRDKKKPAAIEDYLERLRRAYAWVYSYEEEWAKVWAKDTGLPEDVHAFTELKLIPRKVGFAAFTDPRFSGGLPPSTTSPRPSEVLREDP